MATCVFLNKELTKYGLDIGKLLQGRKELTEVVNEQVNNKVAANI